jgi:hypothetical protein
VTTLARLVSEVRAAAADKLWSSLYELAGAKMRRRLDALLVVPEGSRLSELERLRTVPARLSAAEMAWALERLGAVRDLGTGGLDLGERPAGRLAALARYGMAAPVGALREMTVARRTATLLATPRRLEAQAADEALDLSELLYATKVDAKAERFSAKERLAALPRLARAAARLAAGVRVLMNLPPDSGVGVGEAWAQVEAAVGKARLISALEVVDELVPDDEDDEGAKRAELVRRFATLRSFWPALVEVLPLGAAAAGTAVLAAGKALPELFGRKKVTTPDIDESLLAGSWRRLVLPKGLKAGLVDRRAHTLAVAEAFRLALRRRDVFVTGAGRWGDPTAKMLSAEAWSAQTATVLKALQLPAEPGEHLGRLAQELDDAYRGVAARLGANEPATVKDRPRPPTAAGGPGRAGVARRAAPDR